MHHPEFDVGVMKAELKQLETAAGGELGPVRCETLTELCGPERRKDCAFAGNPTSSPIVAAGRLPPDQRSADPDAGIVLTDL